MMFPVYMSKGILAGFPGLPAGPGLPGGPSAPYKTFVIKLMVRHLALRCLKLRFSLFRN